MHEQLEQREALPAHPLPAGLAASDDWRLRVDGLVAQPLALSLREVDALEAQAHAADFVCEEDWVVPEQQWAGVAVAAILARAGVQPTARFLKVYAGAYTSVKWVDRLEVLAEDTATTGEGLARARLQR